MKTLLATRGLTLAVLLAFSSVTVACDSDSSTADTQPSLLEVAESNGFTTLIAAVEAAGLSDVLNSNGPFTVFAPTNEAFAKLPAGTIDELLKPENTAALADILTYHVVEGRVTSDQVVNLSTAKTVQGQNLKIEVADGTVRINDATVTAVDVEARNGVIHIIDSVLLPTAE